METDYMVMVEANIENEAIATMAPFFAMEVTLHSVIPEWIMSVLGNEDTDCWVYTRQDSLIEAGIIPASELSEIEIFDKLARLIENPETAEIVFQQSQARITVTKL